ncbi:hypothetical protein AURDEDRAFT_58667 [Auricularia subglabra TFB-10046 SS5]|nr:hypothetical protein AURDEDRAFT_58667 [Auricularia subglabra TFB-10046 SS5]
MSALIFCRERKVHDGTTCRRHVDAYHRVSDAYNEWCAKNKFESKLNSYKVAKRKEAAEKAASLPSTVQTSLDSHLVNKPPPYSDALLRQAIIDWLVETNQPLSAVDHPRFRHMLEVASRAKNGIKIPSRKATRAEILQVFRQHMADLKKRLTVHSNL